MILLIKRAILSVSDKTGLDILIDGLVKWNVELISTSGTARIIKKSRYDVIDALNYTNMPEMPGGLVKTLHPKIHIGILGDSDNPEHKVYMKKYNIEEIDLVVVNFYPFKNKVEKDKMNFKSAANYIDVGGFALARTAAKATFLFGRVTVLTSPTQYAKFLEEMERNDGSVSHRFKLWSAVQAFVCTSSYEEDVRDHYVNVLKNSHSKNCIFE